MDPPKKIGAGDRKQITERLPPTSLFDALYRLHIRSNYADADSFLLTLDNESDAIRFDRALWGICWNTLLVLETQVARYVGKGVFGEVVEEFLGHDRGGFAEGLVWKRWRVIRELL